MKTKRSTWRFSVLTLAHFVPIAVLGNMGSEFYKQRDWLHVGFAGLAAVCLFIVYFADLYPRNRQL